MPRLLASFSLIAAAWRGEKEREREKEKKMALGGVADDRNKLRNPKLAGLDRGDRGAR